MNYLGLDFGLSHLGVAIADGPLAEPMATLPISSAFKLLPQIIARHHITALIIGLPDGPSQPQARRFIHQLQTLNCPVHIVDETLSSYDALTLLRHTSPSRRKSKEHAAAAAIILQSWLDLKIKGSVKSTDV